MNEFKVDGNLIYNLKQDGYDHGKPLMINDITVTIHGRSNEENQKLALEICGLLNINAIGTSLKDKCIELIKKDKRIAAMKLYFDEKGVELSVAKNQIEEWEIERAVAKLGSEFRDE